MMTPVKPDADLVEDNPLGKIPCLVTDDGAVLYNSPVICEYLDSLHDGPKMFPAGPARWTALRRQAQGDGILDAACSPATRPFSAREERRWPEWIEGQKLKFRRPWTRSSRGRCIRRHGRHRHHHDWLRARLSRFPLRRRGLARVPAEARRLVRAVRAAALDGEDRPGRGLVTSRPCRRPELRLVEHGGAPPSAP